MLSYEMFKSKKAKLIFRNMLLLLFIRQIYFVRIYKSTSEILINGNQCDVLKWKNNGILVIITALCYLNQLTCNTGCHDPNSVNDNMCLHMCIHMCYICVYICVII